MKNSTYALDPEDYWEDPSLNVPPGCKGCIWHPGICDGARAKSATHSCRDWCCDSPATCSVVCPNRELVYLWRVQEVGGFELIPSTVPATPVDKTLSGHAPVIYHGDSRTGLVDAPTVAIPLKHIMTSRGRIIAASRAELLDRFKISPDARLVITGIAEDSYLETYWSSGRYNSIASAIAALGPDLVTTPNYSFFSNRPRDDGFHNQKRITIVYDELARTGVPVALHVNAVYEGDWRRWADYIRQSPYVTSIAFEFGTGVTQSRAALYAHRLASLQDAAKRELALVTQGGTFVLPDLAKAFRQLIFLDSNSFSKAFSRITLTPGLPGKLGPIRPPKGRIEWIDDVLRENIRVMAARLRVLAA